MSFDARDTPVPQEELERFPSLYGVRPKSDEYPPEQRGDNWIEAHGGNGAEETVPGPGPSVNGHSDEEHSRKITAADVATIDDLVRVGSGVRWLWNRWIPQGVLTAIAAEGGKGKTRFCADLLRRIGRGLPWPDGSPMQAPADFLSLWVMADNHHDELVTLSQSFGIAHMIRLNALKTDPYGGVSLDTAEELGRLDSIIQAVEPHLVIVDTVGNATEKNLSRQEDAKAFYFPLQVMARRHSCAFLCLTHLNATGAFLGRRVLEKVRVAIRLQQPKGQDRRRLEVYKSNSRKPPPLGMTMGDGGNDYDDRPPEEEEQVASLFSCGEVSENPARGGRSDARLQACADWLFEQVSSGPVKVGLTRAAAESAGYDAKLLYRAKDRLGLSETVIDGRKLWSFAQPFA